MYVAQLHSWEDSSGIILVTGNNIANGFYNINIPIDVSEAQNYKCHA